MILCHWDHFIPIVSSIKPNVYRIHRYLINDSNEIESQKVKNQSLTSDIRKTLVKELNYIILEKELNLQGEEHGN